MAIPALAGALISTGLSAEGDKKEPLTRRQIINRGISGIALPATGLGEKILGPAAGNPVQFALGLLNPDKEDEREKLLTQLATERARLENQALRQSNYAVQQQQDWARSVRNAFMR